MTRKPTTTKAAKAKTKTKTKVTKRPTEEQLIAKLAVSKDPDTLLDKLGVRNADLWRWYESGRLPLTDTPIGWIAEDRLEGVPPELVLSIARRAAPDAMRQRTLRSVIVTGYVAHPEVWEAALPALPQVVGDILWYARLQRRISVADDVRERVLALYLELAFEPHNGLTSSTVVMVEELIPADAWHRRVIARLAELGDAEPTHDITIAFQVATWDDFFAYASRHPEDLDSSDVDEVIARLRPSAAQLLAFRTLACELDSDIAWEVLQVACTNMEVPPEGLEDLVVDGFAEDLHKVEQMAAIMALPEARRDAFLARALDGAEPKPELAGLLRDPALDDRIVDDIVEAASGGDWHQVYDSINRTLRDIVPCQLHAITLIDRAWARLATGDFERTWCGIQVRSLFRRVKFMATRGMRERPWHLVMPSDELQWATDVGDMVGNDDALSLMPAADIDRLFAAYAPLDWDGTLHLHNTFDGPHMVTLVRPPIESRPWQELVELVGQTSFRRLAGGEEDQKTLTRVFNRPDPLADRIALATAIADREAAFTAANPKNVFGVRAMMFVLGALAPHVIASRQPLPPKLADAALRVLREDLPEDIRDLLLALPRPQVDGWLHALAADRRPTVKKRAKEYAKLV